MFYPKIPRQSIALLLLCLIFTLVAVGFSFLIYFFYNSNDFMENVQKRWSIIDGNGAAYHGHHPAGSVATISAGNPDDIGTYTHFLSTNEFNINANGAIDRTKTVNQYQTLTGNHQNERHHGRTSTVTGNRKHHHLNSMPNHQQNIDETIYIDDDYTSKMNDGSLFPVKSLDTMNIEYFDQIIPDHDLVNVDDIGNNKNGNDFHPNPRIDIENQDRKDIAKFIVPVRNVLVYTKNMDNLRQSQNQNVKYDAVNTENDDNDDEDELINSGSGDSIIENPINQNQYNSNWRTNVNRNDYGTVKRLKQMYKNQNNNENFYSVSSEIVSNLSPLSILKRNGNSVTSTKVSKIGKIGKASKIGKDVTVNRNTAPIKLSKNNWKIEKNERIDQVSDNDRNLDGSSSSSSSSSGSSSSIGGGSGNSDGKVSSSSIMIDVLHPPWLENGRARRVMGNVKKSEERSRQLLLCEEAGGGELCRMLFKGYLNE